jgi:hypothetical protein
VRYQVVGGSDTLQLELSLFDLIIVLTPEHLQHAIGGHAEECRLGRIGMIGWIADNNGGLIVVIVSVLNGRSVQWIGLRIRLRCIRSAMQENLDQSSSDLRHPDSKA